jgi:hypothetical protein
VGQAPVTQELQRRKKIPIAPIRLLQKHGGKEWDADGMVRDLLYPETSGGGE